MVQILLLHGTLTGRLQAFDVSGSLQEVAAQEEEQEKEGHHRDDDPGDHRHSQGDDTDDLQQQLPTGNRYRF